MKNSVEKDIVIPRPRTQVWRAITDSTTLAQWMYPNNFEPRVGHHFTFEVPGDPKVNFDGLTVHCTVLECTPPSSLAFTWKVEGLVDTEVRFRLESMGDGTRLLLEHSGFDLSVPFGKQALGGASYGWDRMLGLLQTTLEVLPPEDAPL